LQIIARLNYNKSEKKVPVRIAGQKGNALRITVSEVAELIQRYGSDILASEGMQKSRGFIQHGSQSVYDHSVHVTGMCIRLTRKLNLSVNERALVRGALLHDYFLYDWHSDGPKWHGFRHAAISLKNARRDFSLSKIEADMIWCHMFPLNFRLPRYRESWILVISDKICSVAELSPIQTRLPKRLRYNDAGIKPTALNA